MEEQYFEDKTFTKDWNAGIYTKRCVFDNCTFKSCLISDQSFLQNRFSECTFDECNLSLLIFDKCVLNDVVFKDCKLLGTRFDCAEKFGFSVSFENCNLSNANFSNRKMPKTLFKKCNLKEADFGNTDLTRAIFDNCDLTETFFDRTILTHTDFVSAYGYSFNPENNKIEGAMFSVDGLPGLLSHYRIQVKF